MSKLEELFQQFKHLSPQERNDLLQAVVSARVNDSLNDGEELDTRTIELYKALIKSFGISIQWDSLNDNDDRDVF